MSKVYNMRILIDEDHYPDLYARLSEARHPRARAEMLRHMASQFLVQQAGRKSPSAYFSPPQTAVMAPVSEPTQARAAKPANPPVTETVAPAESDGLRLSANRSSALVAGVGKYLT
jgi:hypothetical protein